MDCSLIQPDLVGYHFADLEEEARQRVEEHLVGCPQCLRDFIALKREMETTPERPSPAAKDRLRKAVLREVGSRERGVAWSWWERPLAAAFASAAVLAAMLTVHVIASSEGAPPHEVTEGTPH